MPEMRTGHNAWSNATVVDLIRTAWGIDASQVIGGPAWLDERRFDVVANGPSGLKQLLADRFHLKTHSGSQNFPAWEITAGERPQMRSAEAPDDGKCLQRRAPNDTLAFECRGITMAQFADALPGLSGANGYLYDYRVLDRTGLRGAWDFDLQWSQRDVRKLDLTTLQAAIEKQIGLKLKMAEAPLPVVIVDRVDDLPGSPAVAKRLEFEVAEIKPDKEIREGSYVSIQPGGRVKINMSVKGLIAEAWGDINPSRIMGVTKEMDEGRFEVLAKAPLDQGGESGWHGAFWNGVDLNSMRMMLRSLLEDRFRLRAHEEEQEIPGFALTKGKPKLTKADPRDRPGCGYQTRPEARLANPVASAAITCRNVTMAQFVKGLNDAMPDWLPFSDETDMSGSYDISLTFTPNWMINILTARAQDSDPVAGVITLQDELSHATGLKLQPRKVKTKVLVVDNVNAMPTEN